MKFSRYPILAVLLLVALLGLEVSSGLYDEVLAQAQDQPECTVMVQPGESIQQAIDQAQRGDVICLAEGTWKENIKIEKSLTLRGARLQRTILDGEGLGLGIGNGIEIGGEARVTIDGLIVRNYDSGLWVGGSATMILIGSQLSENGFIGGLWVGGSATVMLIDSQLFENQNLGLLVRDSAQVNLTNSQVSENWMAGLRVLDSATVSLTDSTISGNGMNGLEVRDAAQVSLKGSTISGHRMNGLSVSDSATVTLENSTVSGNGDDGLWVWDSALVSLTDSQVSDNKGDGLAVGESAKAELKDNVVKNNERCGIYVGSATQVRGGPNKMGGNGADLCGYAPAVLRKPLVPPDPRTSLSVPADYKTIQEAIDAIVPGGTITVAAGIYHEGLTLWKPLSLVGAGKEQTTLQMLPERELIISIIAEAQRVVLQSLTVTGNLRRRRTGLLIYGRAELQKLQVFGNWYGLLVEGSATVTLADSTFSGNGSGLEVEEEAQVTMNNSRFENNLFFGVYGVRGARIFGWGNRFSGNGVDASGTDVRRLSRTPLANPHSLFQVAVPRDVSTIQAAIDLVADGGTITIAAGSYDETLEIVDISFTMIRAGKEQVIISSQGLRGPGIIVTSKSEKEVRIEGLTISGEVFGLLVRDSAIVSLTDSQISWSGLGVWDSAQVNITNSQVSENWDGLEVRDAAQVSLTDSTISENRDNGLEVWDSATVTLENSTVSGNGDDGLMVRDSALVSLTDSQVSDNKGDGLSVWELAQATLTHTPVSDNGRDGLWVGGEARVEVQASTIEGNGTDPDCQEAGPEPWKICNGIGVQDEAQVTVCDSTIRSNTDWGIATKLEKCGYRRDDFEGEVMILNTEIYSNGQGQVCLP